MVTTSNGLTDDQKNNLQRIHEYLQNNVNGWQKKVKDELVKTKKPAYSSVTISRTLNAWRNGYKPNLEVVAAAKSVYLEAKEQTAKTYSVEGLDNAE
jgi:hypothetical protein